MVDLSIFIFLYKIDGWVSQTDKFEFLWFCNKFELELSLNKFKFSGLIDDQYEIERRLVVTVKFKLERSSNSISSRICPDFEYPS